MRHDIIAFLLLQVHREALDTTTKRNTKERVPSVVWSFEAYRSARRRAAIFSRFSILAFAFFSNL